MHPTDSLKSLDIGSPDLHAEITQAFPEHDIVVISGGGTPIAYIVHDKQPSVNGIMGGCTPNPLLDNTEFLLDMLACEAYTDVPQLSAVTTAPEEFNAANDVYATLNEAPVHKRREKPPDSFTRRQL